MSLLDIVKADMKRFLETDFSVTLTFQTPNKLTSVEVTGLASSHHLSINPETGQPINVRNTHCSVSELALIDEGYTVRNSNGEVALKGHLVTYTNSAGQEKTYKINETWPDETLGLIVCILGDYNGS